MKFFNYIYTEPSSPSANSSPEHWLKMQAEDVRDTASIIALERAGFGEIYAIWDGEIPMLFLEIKVDYHADPKGLSTIRNIDNELKCSTEQANRRVDLSVPECLK